MFLPYKVDVPMARWPIANWVLIGVTTLASFMVWVSPDEDLWKRLALHRAEWFQVQGLITHLFVHGDIFHLAGNMFFLFLFGNAVNARIGHWQFLALYFAAGIFAGLAWVLLGSSEVTLLGIPMGRIDISSIGASGAIMGMVGVFLVLYPRNEVSVYWGISVWYGNTIEISAYWVILMYIAFDIWGLVSGRSGVGYLAHIGGTVSGIASTGAMVWTGLIQPVRNETNLLQMLGLKPANPEDEEPVVPRTRPMSRRRFLVYAKDRQSGFTTELTIEAYSANEASRKAATEDLVVTRIEQIP